MQCNICRYINHENAMICGNCGAPLHRSVQVAVTDEPPKKALIKKLLNFLSRMDTEKLDETRVTQRFDVRAELRAELETAAATKFPTDITRFPRGSSLLLTIQGRQITIDEPETEIVFGRFGEMVNIPRDVYPVNLTDYSGYALGVSRIHASLRPTQDERLEVMDLASSNGTFLNGSPLNPYESYDVYHGDELTLGQLHIHVQFVVPAQT